MVMLAVLVIAAVSTACGGGTQMGGSGASCVAPYVDDQPPGVTHDPPPAAVAAGDTITLYGHWYTSTCNDTGRDDALRPLPSVTLTVVLADHTDATIGTFTPGGPDMGFAADWTVPAKSASGIAIVTATIQTEPDLTTEFPVTITTGTT